MTSSRKHLLTPNPYSSFVAGLVAAIHEYPSRAGRGDKVPGGWVYIVTNRPNGTLYVGVTDDLPRRAWEHRAGLVEGFTKQYGLTRLVFTEYFDNMLLARQRERNMKHWRRSWK